MAVSLHHKRWGSADDPIDTEEEDGDNSEVADALLGFFSDPSDASNLPFDSIFDSLTPMPTPTPPDASFGCRVLPSTAHPSFSAPPDLYAPGGGGEFRRLYHHCWKRPRSCSNLNRPPSEPSAAAGASNWERREAGGRCLSVQRVAARARRKRISEKTQELGRLIPGGNRMSTAEMFQAAFKYVKFLQAQVGILGLMSSLKDHDESKEVEQRLGGLLGSMAVQEKLTGEGRCIVPEEAVNVISKDDVVKSNPFVARELDRFIDQLQPSHTE